MSAEFVAKWTDEAVRAAFAPIFRDPMQPNLSYRLHDWRQALRQEYSSAKPERQQEIALTVAIGAVALASGVAEWSVPFGREHRGKVDHELLADERAGHLALLREVNGRQLFGPIEVMVASLSMSDLLNLTQMSHSGECNTWWLHDYACGLPLGMLRGAIGVTTNPVLIGTAVKKDQTLWLPMRDQLREQGLNGEGLARAMTVRVVVANARLLRPIWNISNQQLGYVSLQLSPQTAFDSERMIDDATGIWKQLTDELFGTPNCVFKVPGTKAGIEVAGELTKRGIGVNVTVNFSLPQQIAFAGAIESASTAPLSFRTQMDGRVDDPIGEELKAAGVADWEEVKTWATTAIRQRDYRMLCLLPEEGGVGFKRSFCLGAAGRGPWNILRSLCNGPQPLFLTIFPDRQEEFDAQVRRLRPNALWDEVPAEKLEKLYKSRLFRQAFEPDGMTPDEFDGWLPVQRTLKQFTESYSNFVAWCDCKRDTAA